MIDAPALDDDLASEPGLAVAVLAGGCFWCVQAVFDALPGVLRVIPGYCGGAAATARYAAVCNGDTGHAEAVRIEYDPAQLTYGGLLRVFFGVAHDPTQRNRQGADIGTQYRSAVFPAGSRQQAIAEGYIAQLNRSQAFGRPVVTEVLPLTAFYPAEAEHHGYAACHPEQPYIVHVAAPKVRKLADWLATVQPERNAGA